MLSFLKRPQSEKSVEITISNSTVIRVLALVIGSFLFLAALDKASHAVILIFTAFFLSLALNAPVRRLANMIPGKRKGSRKLGVALSFLLIIVILGSFLASIVPPLIRQTSSFIEDAPRLVEDLRSEDNSLGRFVRRYNLEDQTAKLSDELSARLGNLTGSAVSTFARITSSVLSTLTVLVLTVMMLVEGPYWAALVLRVSPNDQKKHVKQLGNDMYKVIKGYVNGQVTLAALAALVIFVPLLLFNVSYPIAMMVIVFICGLIPLVGHTIGALIVGVVALFNSPLSALGIIIFYILYQQIENYVLQPKIQSSSTNLSPLLVFASVIIGVNFGGLFGGLVAIPLAACVKVLVVDYMVSRKILDKPEAKEAAS